MGLDQSGCCSGADHPEKDSNMRKEAQDDVHNSAANEPILKKQASPFVKSVTEFYENLMVSCARRTNEKPKCGSDFGQFCGYLFERRPDAKKEINANEKDKIHSFFKDEAMRKYFVFLLENAEHGDKYDKLYDHLTDKTAKVDEALVFEQLVSMIQNQDFFLLQCASNTVCKQKVKEEDANEIPEKLIVNRDHRVISCEWRHTVQRIARLVVKEYFVHKNKSNDLPATLYHASSVEEEATFEMLFPIYCTASKEEAEKMATNNTSICTMYRFDNVSKALSKGKLIAAPYPISPDMVKEEWIILPLRVLDVEQTEETMGDNCKIVKITKYSAFTLNFSGVDAYAMSDESITTSDN